jgi:DnaJ homolog subfamily A member 5
VPFDDSTTGFFGIAKATFEHLAAEEAAAARYSNQEPVEYPAFGNSDDDYELLVKLFYRGWSGFATKKAFSWKDKYKLSDAPDRQFRRLMEKENKKLRDDAINEFNDAVRFLLAFVRKRDPRYVPNTQTHADRQKALRDAAAARSARDRAANLERLADGVVADWAQARQEEERRDEYTDDQEEEESEIEHIECVVCNKTFKSDKQYVVHEESKKHLKAVQQLRRQMRKENNGLGLAGNETRSQESGSEEDVLGSLNAIGSPLEYAESGTADPTSKDDYASNSKISTDSHDRRTAGWEAATSASEDEEYAPRNEVEERLFADQLPGKDLNSEDASEALGNELNEGLKNTSLVDKMKPKIGKAKLKREKKAARREANDVSGEVSLRLEVNRAFKADSGAQSKCSVCHTTFPSRTKLFSHIRDSGHAAPVQEPHNGWKETKK